MLSDASGRQNSRRTISGRKMALVEGGIALWSLFLCLFFHGDKWSVAWAIYFSAFTGLLFSVLANAELFRIMVEQVESPIRQYTAPSAWEGYLPLRGKWLRILMWTPFALVLFVWIWLILSVCLFIVLWLFGTTASLLLSALISSVTT